MNRLLIKLIKIKLLSPKGLWYLMAGLAKGGVNLMALLEFSARMHPNKIAIVDESQQLTYQELKDSIDNVVQQLHQKEGIKKGQKVAVFCQNHIALVQAIFAISRLGADLYLLNVEMSFGQAQRLAQKHDFDCVIYDTVRGKFVQESGLAPQKIIATSFSGFDSIDKYSKTKTEKKVNVPRANKGKIIVLTGGTTGDFKIAARKPSVFTFLNPFFALLTQLNLDKYSSVYIATPIYHGFGVSSIFISLVLGAKMLLMRSFDAQKACELIKKEKAQVVTLVPLMLQRMLDLDKNALGSLETIISGGAALPPKLVAYSNQVLGAKLSNLYGTSEAGFSVMATPQDLQKNINTIGKPIAGVLTQIVDEKEQQVPKNKVGRLWIRSKWTMTNKKEAWVDTGDLAYQNKEGYCFLCGRSDDMIVSGGENVYPIELEHILLQHEAIKEAAVVGISDEEFGQRLKAVVVLEPRDILTKEELATWLKTKVARYQQPKEIIFVESLPYTAIGKLNRKALR